MSVETNIEVETAVIPVAGAGTRVFSITTSIEKCMLPIYAGEQSRPVVDYMVEDCALAGIKRIIFVTSERGETQLSEYFEDINPNLIAQLKRLGKDDKIEKELERRNSFPLTYEYIIQPPAEYGTAYPPFLAKSYLAGEKQFALMGGDDFIYHQDGTSELALAIEAWGQAATDHVIMGKTVSHDEGPKYGILQTDNEGRLINIDEQPPLERVPQEPNVNISRYLLSDAIWPQIDDEMNQNRGTGEHRITDCINEAIKHGQTFFVHPVTGKYLDGGTFGGLMQASQYVSDHPRIYSEQPLI